MAKTYLISALTGAAFDAARQMFADDVQPDITEILHYKLFESAEAAHIAGESGVYGEYDRTELLYEDDDNETEMWYAYGVDGENVLGRIVG